ncbi:NUDIX domain-containing protein [Amphibacillus sp. Q70]|uniref:NUDIX domain-containing protein n=1 Tax=Amphibacillus sp. Q70 TaxID=3453416 RepID=UPI003F845713
MDKTFRNMTSIYLVRGDEILFLYRMGSAATQDAYIATAGGHFEPEEINEPKKCVLRELYEETGLTVADIKNMNLRYIALRNTQNEIRQIYYYFAELKCPEIEIVSNEGMLSWVKMKDALALDMPLTAKQVIEHYLTIGKDTTDLYGRFTSNTDLPFTLFSES